MADSRRKSGGRLSGSIQSGQDMTKSPVALPKVGGKKTRRGKKGGRRHRKQLHEKLFQETLRDERVLDIRRGVEALHVACLSDVSEWAGPHLTNTSVHTSQTSRAEQTPRGDTSQQQVALPYGYSATYNINEYGYHPNGCGYASDDYTYAQNGYGYSADHCGYSQSDIGNCGYAQCGYGFRNDNYGYAQYGYGFGNDNYGYAQYGYGFGNDNYGYAQYGYGFGNDNYGYAQYGYGFGNDNYGYAHNGHRYVY